LRSFNTWEYLGRSCQITAAGTHSKMNRLKRKHTSGLNNEGSERSASVRGRFETHSPDSLVDIKSKESIIKV